VGSDAYTVYLLVSLRHDFRYVGFCRDTSERLKQHDRGQTRSTAPYAPFRMLVLRSVANRNYARRSEKYFKSGQGRAQIARLLSLETRRGHLIEDAEQEGLLRNPFVLENDNR